MTTAAREALTGWAPDPFLLLAAMVAGLLYATGLRRLWASAGRGMVVRGFQAWAFVAGLTVLVVALASPVDAFADDLLAWHMLLHLLLGLVAAPLLALSAPLQTMVWGLAPDWRRRVGRWQGRVLRWGRSRRELAPLATVAWIAVLYAWHVPALYDAAVASAGIHALEHVSLLAAGLAFWSVVLAPRRKAAWRGLLLLFTSAVAGGLLSALLTFAPSAWFTAHVASAPRWGLDALSDQQLAGAVLWVPGGAIHLLAAALLFSRWLREDAVEASRHSTPRPAVTS